MTTSGFGSIEEACAISIFVSLSLVLSDRAKSRVDLRQLRVFCSYYELKLMLRAALYKNHRNGECIAFHTSTPQIFMSLHVKASQHEKRDSMHFRERLRQ